jgi:FkbM family methyltransferase
MSVTIKGIAFGITQKIMAQVGLSVSVGPQRHEILSVISKLAPQPSPYPLIRIGGNSDGGYLVPDDLDGVVACFSPGVAESADFELDLAKHGVKSFMADFSVDRAPFEHELFDFEKLFVATYNEEGKFVRLDDWISAKVHDSGDLILQMDIEGNEWSVLADMSVDTLSRFRLIVLELHGLDTLITSPTGISIFETVVKKLTSQFTVVHLHANNCCGQLDYKGVKIPRVLEVSLIRNNRYDSNLRTHPPVIPNPLDAPNAAGKQEIMLSKDWLSKTE